MNIAINYWNVSTTTVSKLQVIYYQHSFLPQFTDLTVQLVEGCLSVCVLTRWHNRKCYTYTLMHANPTDELWSQTKNYVSLTQLDGFIGHLVCTAILPAKASKPTGYLLTNMNKTLQLMCTQMNPYEQSGFKCYSRKFQSCHSLEPPKRFPGLCRSPAMLNYSQTAVTDSVCTAWQYNPLQNVHHKLQWNCSVSTLQEYFIL